MWDIIRDYLVQYFFGGTTSTGQTFANTIGNNLNSSSMTLDIGNSSIALGDYLSTTATIIILVLFAVALYLLIKWVFKLVQGAFRF